MLGLEYEFHKGGYLGVEYEGRHVMLQGATSGLSNGFFFGWCLDAVGMYYTYLVGAASTLLGCPKRRDLIFTRKKRAKSLKP